MRRLARPQSFRPLYQPRYRLGEHLLSFRGLEIGVQERRQSGEQFWILNVLLGIEAYTGKYGCVTEAYR